jgi:predicted nucleotidyltransferase
MNTKKTKRRGKPDPAVLEDVVQRIVRAVQPERIILFGSAARGEMGPDSDLDLLVIKAGKFNHWRLLTTMRRALRGSESAVDLVVATPEDVEQYQDAHCLVICPAVREGKVVYAAN